MMERNIEWRERQIEGRERESWREKRKKREGRERVSTESRSQLKLKMNRIMIYNIFAFPIFSFLSPFLSMFLPILFSLL